MRHCFFAIHIFYFVCVLTANGSNNGSSVDAQQTPLKEVAQRQHPIEKKIVPNDLSDGWREEFSDSNKTEEEKLTNENLKEETIASTASDAQVQSPLVDIEKESNIILQNDVKFPSHSEKLNLQKQDKKRGEEENLKNLNEAQIAVLKEEKKSHEGLGSQTSSWRVYLSLIMVVFFAIATTYAVKYWTRNRLGQQDQNKIRILSQHHLGPKRSLMIVQVAGEAMLIGATEQNIHLIKSLSLLDDEIPDHAPSDFSEELEQIDRSSSLALTAQNSMIQHAVVRDRVQIQSSQPTSQPKEINMSAIASMVKDRLKEMRSL